MAKGDRNDSGYGLIGQGINVSGDINFTDQLQVEGRIVGKVNSTGGTLVIGETGELEAQVDVGICVVYGSLYGDLIAKTRVEIRNAGKIDGDVATPVLLVEEGAVFNGAIRMGKEPVGRKLEEVQPPDIEIEKKLKFKGA